MQLISNSDKHLTEVCESVLSVFPLAKSTLIWIYKLFLFLLRAGQLDMSTALGLTNYLDKEREYVPWSSAFSHLGFIGSMLSMRPSYGFYRVSMGLNML